MNTLREMLDLSSPWIAERFAKTGVIYPMWHVVCGDGRHEIKTGIGPDKDTAAVLMRAYFELVQARRYLFIDEAWMAVVGHDRAKQAIRYAHLGRLSEFPDRRECVMFAGEDRNGDTIMAQRFILRPEHGKPTLAPLQIEDKIMKGESTGRFVNMLNNK